MPADLSITQIAMFGAIGVGVVIGLFRGFSGGLGTLGGIAAGVHSRRRHLLHSIAVLNKKVDILLQSRNTISDFFLCKQNIIVNNFR